ncbi:hypothetical protein GE061_010103 [Apolygus lucorum]|uniref:Rho guanine nucleotide exchange factor 12 n=1 Tax=Apolygus lucorum TaxID=248454 RepID=A0A8S9Y455_APOLU|nr:hypothetical protein GE061_010103 [Apolygus lucorum]
MDINSSGVHDKRLSNGPSFRRGPGRESAHHMTTLPTHCTTLTIYKDEIGYGMKVSGDNPVYVQSVKEGGAAEKAGLHSGDTILKVNGVNVTSLTHIEVVELIKAEAQVVLTVQQNPLPLRERSGSTVMPSPNLPRQLSSAQSRDRITAPQPVDNEKMRQFEYQRAHTLKLMLEKEQRNVESLRSKRAKCSDSGTEAKILQDLHGAERRISTLMSQLEQEGMEPPPLPTRSRRPTLSPPPPARPSSSPSSPFGPPLPSTPPPLPPRQYLLLGGGDHLSPSTSPGANHQVHSHQRTKSSPDNMTANSSLAEASKRLIASESMSELSMSKRSRGGVAWEVDRPTSPSTPPGTPPPPYNMGYSALDDTVYSHIPEEDSPPRAECSLNETDHATSPTKNFNFLAQGSPQQPIISMEDEDMSDQEMSQMEDHGPFKRWNKLSKHQAHLAVFLNYVISNSDPSSLLFYLVTDLYKEGSAKEMKKWAYEIHSSFLVPGAPLRLNNVDENVAREIDEVLLNESDKEEILRMIFRKARQKAKDELNEQLADFQAKRTAGLGTLFGPKDAELEESIHDKNKEMKIIESVLVPKLEPYMEDIENGTVDDRRFTTGAALGTILSKVFGIRGQHFNSLLERCPTYVSKDKSRTSAKARLIGKSRKVSIRGHQCNAHQYFIVTYCNHCQTIIWGIGPQGYRCSNCGLNIHRRCVNVLEENCPGPMVNKKENRNDRIRKLVDKIRERKPSSPSVPNDRPKKVPEEAESAEPDTGTFDCANASSLRGGRPSRPPPRRRPLRQGPFMEIVSALMEHNEASNTKSLKRSSSFKKLLKLPIWASGK